MAQKISQNYKIRTRVRRRNKPHPLNICKKLGPKSCHRGITKEETRSGLNSVELVAHGV